MQFMMSRGPEVVDLTATPKQGWFHPEVSDVRACAGAPLCNMCVRSQAYVCVSVSEQ